MATPLEVYATCQTGCNVAWVACCATAGVVACTVTAGSGAPALVLLCLVQQGVCVASCATMAGLAGAAESAAVVGPVAAASGSVAAGSAAISALLLVLAGGSILAAMAAYSSGAGLVALHAASAYFNITVG